VRPDCDRGRLSSRRWRVQAPAHHLRLARASRNDIDKAWEAVRHAARPRIHTFLATSEIHMQYKLKLDREQVLERVIEMVSYARSLCQDVEFSPRMRAQRSAVPLPCPGQAIQAGATTLNIPDTVGYTTPDEFGALIAGIIQNTPGSKLHRLGALSRRPGTGDGQHAGGYPGRRAPG